MTPTLVVSAQISVYPLRQERLSPAVETVRHALEDRGLRPQVGPMSTVVTGEATAVFAGLQEAFSRAAATGQVVMTVTVSNACPVRERASGGVLETL
jgi:uncharacterized protein YqgV (UPF0045/DUF77 family)